MGDSLSHDALFDRCDLSNHRDQSVGDGPSQSFKMPVWKARPVVGVTISTLPTRSQVSWLLSGPHYWHPIDAVPQITEVGPCDRFVYHAPRIGTSHSRHPHGPIASGSTDCIVHRCIVQRDWRSLDDTFAPLARRMPAPGPVLLRGFPPIGRRGSRRLRPTYFMHRTALRMAAVVRYSHKAKWKWSFFPPCERGVGVCRFQAPHPRCSFRSCPGPVPVARGASPFSQQADWCSQNIVNLDYKKHLRPSGTFPYIRLFIITVEIWHKETCPLYPLPLYPRCIILVNAMVRHKGGALVYFIIVSCPHFFIIGTTNVW